MEQNQTIFRELVNHTTMADPKATDTDHSPQFNSLVAGNSNCKNKRRRG